MGLILALLYCVKRINCIARHGLVTGGSRMSRELIEWTADIVAAYLSKNSVQAGDLPGLISTVHGSLASLGQPKESAEPPAELLRPAVPIKKSVQPDHIVCLEDGKKLKMLKRHLSTSYGMTPDQYRTKWGLPSDYPMVAPNYAKTRSELAIQIGLGRGRRH